jgi:hypothetical protein
VHPIVLFEVADVLHAARRKVIHQEHFIAPDEQSFGQVGANETCTARDQSTHKTASVDLNIFSASHTAF